MSDMMPKKQRDFIENVIEYLLCSTNYGREKSEDIAFCLWQNKEWIARMLREEAYQKGRADQKEEDNAFFNFEGAWELEKKKVRADTIDKFINKVVGLRIYDNDLNLLDLKMVAEQLKDSE